MRVEASCPRAPADLHQHHTPALLRGAQLSCGRARPDGVTVGLGVCTGSGPWKLGFSTRVFTARLNPFQEVDAAAAKSL